MRRRMRATVASNKRDWKIKGTPERHGSYDRQMPWTMTATDIVSAGIDQYVEQVRVWAHSISETLKATGSTA